MYLILVVCRPIGQSSSVVILMGTMLMLIGEYFYRDLSLYVWTILFTDIGYVVLIWEQQGFSITHLMFVVLLKLEIHLR